MFQRNFLYPLSRVKSEIVEEENGAGQSQRGMSHSYYSESLG